MIELSESCKLFTQKYLKNKIHNKKNYILIEVYLNKINLSTNQWIQYFAIF